MAYPHRDSWRAVRGVPQQRVIRTMLGGQKDVVPSGDDDDRRTGEAGRLPGVDGSVERWTEAEVSRSG